MKSDSGVCVVGVGVCCLKFEFCFCWTFHKPTPHSAFIIQVTLFNTTSGTGATVFFWLAPACQVQRGRTLTGPLAGRACTRRDISTKSLSGCWTWWETVFAARVPQAPARSAPFDPILLYNAGCPGSHNVDCNVMPSAGADGFSSWCLIVPSAGADGLSCSRLIVPWRRRLLFVSDSLLGVLNYTGMTLRLWCHHMSWLVDCFLTGKTTAQSSLLVSLAGKRLTCN